MNPANMITLEIIARIEELFAVDEPNLQTLGGELAAELAKRCKEMLHMKGNGDCYRSAMIYFRDKTQKARELVAQQAEDPGLWFAAHTAPEAYLQQNLRALHAAIEDKP